MPNISLFVIAAAVLAVPCFASIPDPVATVNGDAIPASSFLEQCSLRAGQETLKNMVEEKIILQWAKEEQVPPTDEQVARQIAIFKRDGIYEDQVSLEGEDGVKSEILGMQARINLAKKLLGASAEGLEAAYDGMKGRFVHGPRKQVQLIVNTQAAGIDSAAGRIQAGMDFDEAAYLFADKQISGGEPMKTWVDPSQTELPKELIDAVSTTAVGSVSKPFTISEPGGPTMHVILKVLKEAPAQNLTLADVKDEIIDEMALRKAENDEAFKKQLADREKSANIQINIARLKTVAYSFKYPEQPAPPAPPAPAPTKPATKPAAKPTGKQGSKNPQPAFIKTKSRLKYRDIKVGTGAAARVGSLVSVSYKGWLDNGTVFDATSEHGGKPIEIELGRGQVIKGWDEGLQGMKVGGIRELIIPADLAYGARQMGQIPANATLHFRVMLVSVKPAK